MHGRRLRKELAWKKNRRFGDEHGGRARPKNRDGFFRRRHRFRAPAEGTELPVLIEENPSRDFFFPVDGAGVLAALRALPGEEVRGITHVWLHRCRRASYERGEIPLCSFTGGSGVGLVTLSPWPRDRTMIVGTERPADRLLAEYGRWSPDLVRRDGLWRLRFGEDALRSVFLENILLHAVGVARDWDRRRWSAANGRKVTESASQYAMLRSAFMTEILDSNEGA